MIYTIDIGNTNKKYSLWINKEIVEYDDYSDYSVLSPNAKIIVSSVRQDEFHCPLPYMRLKQIINKNSFLDMPLFYSKNIGEDRLASAYYVFKNSKERSMIIDSGTFTTLDIISTKGFEGGIILPGLDLLKENYTQGQLLMSYTLDLNRAKLLVTNNIMANNTKDAINDGLFLTFLSPIKEYINQNTIKRIIITGGNATILANILIEIYSYKIEIIDKLTHYGLYLAAENLS